MTLSADVELDAATWTFVRGESRILLQCPSPTEIVLSGAETVVRRFTFPSAGDRVSFQSGFETHLLDTGWSLAEFRPGDASIRTPRAAPRWKRLDPRRWLRRARTKTNQERNGF